MVPDSSDERSDPTAHFQILPPGTVISHYKIVEKIGSGAMGVVYKALDTKLERPVALKFLSAHLLCDPEARARFEHEARAASALSHANITTIHEIDEDKGRCFIVMELVQGSTVWDLARSADLSLAEIMDVALQIGRGLDAAHKHGVIHRDIKSSNIMVTGDVTVKIMDFGLAKLRDATKLTQAGTTMGTLPYMSPEQLRGEVADQRSDIFSFGVVLYELITGRLPFPGKTEGEIVAAVLNTTPEPPARYKSGVSEGLERVVAKAMAKDKTERYQHVDDMIADLRREARLSEAARSAIAGAGGLRVAAGQAATAGQGPGEPTQQGVMQPAVGPAPHTPAPTSVPTTMPTLTPGTERKHPHSRRALWIAIAAAAAVGAVALIFILEPFHVAMGPAHQAQAMENSLAVMYFENMADPEDSDRTAQMITSLLITDLSESDGLYVISRQRLYDILNLLGREASRGSMQPGVNLADAEVIDSKVATAVAERAGAKWILTGSILRGEPALVLTSDISETASGRIIATQRISGEPGDDLFALADKLSAAIRADLALPQKAGAQPDRPVTAVTTSSPEAYRYYLEGIDNIQKQYTAEAKKALLKALEYDSTFAMAYIALYAIRPVQEQKQLAAAAMRYVDRVSRREQYMVRAVYAHSLGDYAAVIRICREGLAQYPDDKRFFYRMGTVYSARLRQYRNAIEAYTAAIRLDPLYTPAYNSLAYTYHTIGNPDSSIWAINQYIAIAPDEANPYDTRGDLYAYNGKLDEAIASYKEALRIKPDFYASLGKLGSMYLFKRDYAQAEACCKSLAASPDQMSRSEGRGWLALLPIYRGQFEQALKILDDGLAADRLEQCEGDPAAWKHMLKAGIFSERGETEQSVVEAKAASDIMYRDSGTPATDENAYYIYSLAQAGKFAEADAAAEAIKESLGPAQDSKWESYWLALSCIELSGGSPEKAVEHIEKVFDVNPDPQFQRRYILSKAYLGAGRLADGVKELEKAALSHDAVRASTPLLAPKLHYLLGQAYERSGWKDKAAEQYREFLLFWGEGDPGIASVEDARARLAGLEAGA